MYFQTGAGTNHETSFPSRIALRMKVPEISMMGASTCRTEAIASISCSFLLLFRPGKSLG
ncbi:MAG: hypothetical protein BWY89_01072 [Bacteroidetes bacterium ADurb.BinA012]|nr:MAG: hypothetical protein BWY89_01072 [Bacteroidetes bacterium ADurb.BinA012]